MQNAPLPVTEPWSLSDLGWILAFPLVSRGIVGRQLPTSLGISSWGTRWNAPHWHGMKAQYCDSVLTIFSENSQAVQLGLIQRLRPRKLAHSNQGSEKWNRNHKRYFFFFFFSPLARMRQMKENRLILFRLKGTCRVIAGSGYMLDLGQGRPWSCATWSSCSHRACKAGQVDFWEFPLCRGGAESSSR